MHTEPQKHQIHVLIQVGQGEPIRLTFDTDTATGEEIKRRAGFGEVDGLYRRERGEVIEIGDDESVSLENGLRFVIVPNGRVS